MLSHVLFAPSLTLFKGFKLHLFMSLTPFFGVLFSQAGIPLRYPTQSFDYGDGLVSVQGLDCHLGLNHFISYVVVKYVVVIFNTWVRKMFGAGQALSLQTSFKLGQRKRAGCSGQLSPKYLMSLNFS